MTDPLLESVVRANHELFMRTSDRVTRPLEELGLTLATAQALWAIDPDRPPPSMKVLAGRLYCNAPNLSFVVNQLVDRGLVERGTDPADRRARVAVLTGRGREIRKRAVDLLLRQSPFAECEPEELRHLAELLEQVLDRSAD
ncbi:MarR family winged helix-turn-helix transcriptional regulator [Streptomyces kunmingensis]|uniref:MarR family winged helix-turn-helix transcriptional regulator n=1 Tax=Streptomyces kunmingensis TaxID=68225 RepID=A0ABU6CN37_9ACTN|nr:MarR family winged helix-turn-helix transcriptional regulator [Streptomyces kunmingensis]MEB3965760.1 MarR family winged helix-turn-helix transcriptional regulator [Streptomyces kunmingensis]